MCDQNKDGYLDQDEYTAFTHPESFDHTKEVHLEQSFLDMDKNNDGSITIEEYIGIIFISHGTHSIIMYCCCRGHLAHTRERTWERGA